MKKIFTLLSLLVLFSTTISVPFASANEEEFLHSTNASQMEVDTQSEYDLKALEIIKELETSDEGVIVEEYQAEEYKIDEEVIVEEYQAEEYKIDEEVEKAIILKKGKKPPKKDPSKSGPVYKTDKEATTAAKKLGYTKISETCGKAAIFRNKKGKPEYISRDIDGHIGGAWKGGSSPSTICSKDTRSGTYDKNLTRIGD
ncbi:toxin C-terminal domain-containing protein [Lysinibacillus sp. UBA5990]|uniref:toxin C-terminal domain-containing protein n=1 Tax=Lysinibacillus sp. UBA5990 TaxID=1946773 RepID=UPI0039C9022E